MRVMTALSPIAPRGDNNITYRIHSNARTTLVLVRRWSRKPAIQSALADQYGFTPLSLNLKA